MSLMGTLAKVAVGVAVAKGASKLMQGGGSQSGGLGGLLGGVTGAGGAGGLGALLGGGGAQSGGGLGGLLEGLTGGGQQQASAQGGGLNGLIGGFADKLGGGGAAAGAAGAGGLAALAAGLAGKAQGNANSTPDFGAMFNQALSNGGEPDVAPTADQEAVAALMLTAMIQAAKSDGEIDEVEQAKFLEDLGEIDPEELAFLQAAVKSPIDVNALAQQTPKGLETQLYTVSVLAIVLDNEAEARYLHELANALGLSADVVNQIHDQLGVVRIYN